MFFTEAHKKFASPQLEHPELHLKPSNKKPRNLTLDLTPPAAKSCVAFERNHAKLPLCSPNKIELNGPNNKREVIKSWKKKRLDPKLKQAAILRRLVQTTRRQRAEEGCQPYKDLQKEGKYGRGVLDFNREMDDLKGHREVKRKLFVGLERGALEGERGLKKKRSAGLERAALEGQSEVKKKRLLGLE